MSRECPCFRIVAAATALLLLVAVCPAPLFAQNPGVQTAGDACAQGTNDGNRADTAMWFFIGCALGLTGWLIAYVVEPSPPAANLVGKDSVYTMQYLDCYKRAAKSKQSGAALGGCAVGTGITVAIYAIIIATSNVE
jgi:hypothetical protein